MRSASSSMRYLYIKSNNKIDKWSRHQIHPKTLNTHLTLRRLTIPLSRKSFNRPGVAVKTSQPLANSIFWGATSAPPYTTLKSLTVKQLIVLYLIDSTIKRENQTNQGLNMLL